MGLSQNEAYICRGRSADKFCLRFALGTTAEAYSYLPGARLNLGEGRKGALVMAKRNDPARLVAGAGLLADIFTKFSDAVEDLGGTAEDIHFLAKPEGMPAIRKMAVDLLRSRREAETLLDRFPIEELDLGVRTFNFFKRHRIETIGDLRSRTEADIVELGSADGRFSKKIIAEQVVPEVQEMLRQHGLSLRSPDGSAKDDPRIAEAVRVLKIGGQRQDSLSDQLKDARKLLTAAGLYDALDHIDRQSA